LEPKTIDDSGGSAPPTRSEYHSRRVILAVLFVVLAQAGAAFAQAPAATAPPTARWLDLQTLSVSVRHRRIVSSAGVVGKNQLQEKTQVRARLKLDAAARYTVNVGVFSGNGFTSSWNDTGIGTGDFKGQHLVKQLFVSAAPVKGLELQYGGLYVEKGQSSEITYYDEDAYLVGERVAVRRPDRIFFDEVLATLGSLGDVHDSNVFNRFKYLDDTDYKQLQVSRGIIGKNATASLDYVRVGDTSWLRPAMTVRTPWTDALDSARLEVYHRYGSDPATGFAVEGDRQIARVRVGGGYADVDPAYGGLNGDRYNDGKRLYATASIPVVTGLSVSLFGTHTVGSNPPLSNRTRTDVIVTYNFLPLMRKTGAF
jgi:hypothetical protein